MQRICNKSRLSPRISAIFGYPNVNLGYPRDNQKRISKCLQTLETPYVSGVFHFSGNIVEIPPDISPVMEEYMKFLQKMKKTAQKINAME